MRLTLDWDDNETKEQFFPQVTQRGTLTGEPNYTLKRSAGGEGWHYIEYDAASTWPAITQLRDEYGDDENRIRLDLMREMRDSPFLQVLFKYKYLPRLGIDFDGAAGVAEVVERATLKRDTFSDGRIDYQETLRVLRANGVSASDLAETLADSYLDESGGRSASTIRAYTRGDRPVTSDAVRRIARRRLRGRNLGHFSPTAEQPRPDRRTFIEYVDITWKELNGEEKLEDIDPEYRLCQIETGTLNQNIGGPFLKDIHDDLANRILEILSPLSPLTGEVLEHNRRNLKAVNPVSRSVDSLNFEDEPLDQDEADYYMANLPDSESDPREHIFFEVLLFDEPGENIVWQLLGLYDGDSIDDVTILKDTNGWF